MSPLAKILAGAVCAEGAAEFRALGAHIATCLECQTNLSKIIGEFPLLGVLGIRPSIVRDTVREFQEAANGKIEN